MTQVQTRQSLRLQHMCTREVGGKIWRIFEELQNRDEALLSLFLNTKKYSKLQNKLSPSCQKRRAQTLYTCEFFFVQRISDVRANRF